MVSKGKRVGIAYDLTVGGKLMKSIGSAKPHMYVHGKKEIFRGLEKVLQGMKLGERKEFVLSADAGYGSEDPKSFVEVPKTRFLAKDHFVGREIVSKKDGKFLATVKEVRPSTLVLNFNHPFAGKELHYKVAVIFIEGEGAMMTKKEGK